MHYIKIKQLKTKIDCSTNCIYDLVKQGILPKPVKLGGENIWRVDLVDTAIAQMAEVQGAGWALPQAP